ncbi:MAG: hypothetical protein GY854_33640 [Deltaproteobacteria bacterium]|nr:hypothetical protein [Deltaproteobacteria bacterium]
MILRLIATLLVLSALLVSSCGSCETSDNETQIRALIDKGAAFAQKHDIGELMGLTTDGFQAWPGPRDRQSVKGVLFIAFKRYKKFSVKFPRPTVNVDATGVYAEAKTPFLILREGQSMPDLKDLYDDPDEWVEKVDDLADPYHLELWLIKEDGEWLVRKARLHGLKGLGDL